MKTYHIIQISHGKDVGFVISDIEVKRKKEFEDAYAVYKQTGKKWKFYYDLFDLGVCKWESVGGKMTHALAKRTMKELIDVIEEGKTPEAYYTKVFNSNTRPKMVRVKKPNLEKEELKRLKTENAQLKMELEKLKQLVDKLQKKEHVEEIKTGLKEQGIQFRNNSYVVKVTKNRKQLHVGTFKRLEDALQARDKALLS